jgi:hypothetical protein
MAKEYTYLFHSKALQNLPKLGFLVRKYLATLAQLRNGHEKILITKLIRQLHVRLIELSINFDCTKMMKKCCYFGTMSYT